MIFATQKTLMKLCKIACLALLLCLCTRPIQAAENSTGVVINQVQTGATSATSQEYISIYNNKDKPVDVTNWCIVYATASDATQTQLSCIKPPNTRTKLLLKSYQSVTFATTEFAQAHPDYSPDLIFSAGLSGTSGHIKLLDQQKSAVDTVGWGAATKPEGASIPAHANGKILQRKSTEIPNVLQDTNNNSVDFIHADLVLAQSGNLYEEQVIYQCPPEYPLCTENHPIINELFPDPDGADAGKEFIELYNPSPYPIQLKNYVLQLGPSFAKSFLLPDKILAPGEHATFNDVESGITLPNTAAIIRLVSPMGDTISEAPYIDIAEGQSVAFIDDVWQATYQPTPGSVNILLANKPCKAGQIYSEEVGKCSAVATATVPVSCKENQVRNLGTGRCRNIVVAAGPTVCKIGQEKNPATNRCRNIPVAAPVKACPAGQERNAETNRCRKIVANAGASGAVKDVPSPLIKNSVKWWVAGISLVSAAGYALFEWRQEFLNILIATRSKFTMSA